LAIVLRRDSSHLPNQECSGQLIATASAAAPQNS